MNHLKNLAGNDVSVFLFRFDIRGDGISFVLNQGIAEDMYPDLDEKLKPLVHACGETLLRYKRLSVSSTIMDCTVLDSGQCEVMLSKGLGRHVPDAEKQRLFQDAGIMADLLVEVMERRTQERKDGKPGRPPHRQPQSQSRPEKTKKGLEKLGEAQQLLAELHGLAEGRQIRPGLKQLRPDDLPPGVTASRGYDHRGHCIILTHKTLGELGKIVLIQLRHGQTLMQAELNTGQGNLEDPIVKRKRKVFEKLVATVNNCFDDNFPKQNLMVDPFV